MLCPPAAAIGVAAAAAAAATVVVVIVVVLSDWVAVQDPTKISHVITVDGVGTGTASNLYLHSPTADTTFASQVGWLVGWLIGWLVGIVRNCLLQL